MIGEVIRYDSVRAFGFIRAIHEDGNTQAPLAQTEQFFHLNAVVDRLILRAGDIVDFQIRPCPTKPGKTEAAEVRLLKRSVVTEVRS